MNNLIIGIDSLLVQLSSSLQLAARQPIFWGFFIGFLVASLIHGFIISENPKKIHIILFNTNLKGYKKLRNSKMPNFNIYQKIAIQTKFIFSCSIILFLLIIILAITTY